MVVLDAQLDREDDPEERVDKPDEAERPTHEATEARAQQQPGDNEFRRHTHASERNLVAVRVKVAERDRHQQLEGDER